jgi:2-polyprenyl-3-methyl-5-hydroxy-6-metoxy-1,4-benzoquinol methylase
MSKSSVLAVLLLVACNRDHEAASPKPSPKPADGAVAIAPDPTPGSGSDYTDPTLEHDQNEYVDDVMAFTPGVTKEQVRARMKKGSEPLRDEWNKWEAEGKMTPERTTAFYKQTENYIYELAEWHLWVPGKRQSDMQLVKDMQAAKVKNVLDFGGGVGLMAVPLARAGIDVTLADLDSTTLKFAMHRAKKNNIPMKFWKSDVEPMPPDKKYDAILALDVLEHLPAGIMEDIVTKLIKLKNKNTQIVISAPFGKTAVHPMHLDADEHTRIWVEKLKTELPPDAQ